MRLNHHHRRNRPTTHEGAQAARNLTPVQKLRRSVMSCLLWEDNFYEDGQSIATRIQEYAEKVDPGILGSIAIEARNCMYLRHVPLLLCSILSRTGKGSWEVGEVIRGCVQRPDEITELLAIHAYLNGTTPDRVKKHISAQMKRGLAAAFRSFDEYQLAKYNRRGSITLRDAMRLVHPKPANSEQAALWGRLLNDTLETPDTWEVAFSSSDKKKDDLEKRQIWERLLFEGKLGYMALLRNLRNMEQVGVDRKLVIDAIKARKGASKVLPFRYIAAAKASPSYAQALDCALMESLDYLPRFSGTTVVLVDVSGSMVGTSISRKSDMDRLSAASALASIIQGDDIRVFTFSNQCLEVPSYSGLAGVEAIRRSQPHQGTRLGDAINRINQTINHDRIIVITDEQSTYEERSFFGGGPTPKPVVNKAYFINVSCYENGVGYGDWTHIDGFSENIIRYIAELESDEWMDETRTTWRRNVIR